MTKRYRLGRLAQPGSALFTDAYSYRRHKVSLARSVGAALAEGSRSDRRARPWALPRPCWSPQPERRGRAPSSKTVAAPFLLVPPAGMCRKVPRGSVEPN
jgi:hypothetical protein